MIPIHLCLYISNTHESQDFGFEVGGVESTILQLLQEYEKKKNLYISLMTKFSHYKPISKNMKIFQYNKYQIRQINTIYFNLKAFLKIISLNKARKVDVILSFRYSYYEILIPFLLNRLFKIPILIYTPTDFDTYDRETYSSISNSFASKMIYYIWMKFLKNYLLHQKRIYLQAINQHIISDLVGLKVKRNNFVLIPNGININNFKEIRKFGRSEINFGYIGRLIKTKNIRFLIETFKEYLNYFPDDKLLIFGRGLEQNFILKYIKSNNLNDKILLMGFKTNKAEIYNNIDVIIHPSFGEGVPMIILEAALTNTFIIASDVKGNRDIVEHKKTGLLFDPFNQNDLLEKLLFFKNYKNLRQEIIEKAKEFVTSNYDIKNTVDSQSNFIKLNIMSQI